MKDIFLATCVPGAEIIVSEEMIELDPDTQITIKAKAEWLLKAKKS